MQHVFIRWPAVQQATQISRSTAWRLERLGLFPRRRKISAQSVGWLRDEIEDWVLSRSVVDTLEHSPQSVNEGAQDIPTTLGSCVASTSSSRVNSDHLSGGLVRSRTPPSLVSAR